MKVACTINVAMLLRQRSTERREERSVAARAPTMPFGRIDAAPSLRENVFDDVAGDVGQTEVAPLVAVGQPLVIDPQ